MLFKRLPYLLHIVLSQKYLLLFFAIPMHSQHKNSKESEIPFAETERAPMPFGCNYWHANASLKKNMPDKTAAHFVKNSKPKKSLEIQIYLVSKVFIANSK